MFRHKACSKCSENILFIDENWRKKAKIVSSTEEKRIMEVDTTLLDLYFLLTIRGGGFTAFEDKCTIIGYNRDIKKLLWGAGIFNTIPLY